MFEGLYDNPIGFFDGAVVDDCCGIGIFLKINSEHFYRAHFAGGQGNNMKAEILGLWGLLLFASRLSINKMMVDGDSKVAIDWINDKSNLNILYLNNWKEQIRSLKEKFDGINFIHVHRAFNIVVDTLSKKALNCPMGRLFFEESIKGDVVNEDSYLLF
jgi:ribonuclease HI